MSSGQVRQVQELDGCNVIANRLGLPQEENIFIADSVKVFGTDYRRNLIVVIDIDDNTDEMPVFAKISNVILKGYDNER